MKQKKVSGQKIICLNRKASFNYYFLELLEAGIVLKGSEVKSLRGGKGSIADSYAVDNNGERVSGRVPPQMALVTDIGVNITDRFDLSILAAPNRNDIPPQGSLSYQIDQNLSVSGSVDSQGTWQSQLQLFFRF